MDRVFSNVEAKMNESVNYQKEHRSSLFGSKLSGLEAMGETARRLRRESEAAKLSGHIDLAVRLTKRAELLEADVVRLRDIAHVP